MTEQPPPSARLWLPDPPYAARLAVTATIVWIGARLAATVVLAWIAARLALAVGNVLALHPVTALAVVGITAAVVVLEERRRRERLFPANLGISPAWAWIVAAAVGGVLELVMWLMVGSGG